MDTSSYRDARRHLKRKKKEKKNGIRLYTKYRRSEEAKKLTAIRQTNRLMKSHLVTTKKKEREKERKGKKREKKKN